MRRPGGLAAAVVAAAGLAGAWSAPASGAEDAFTPVTAHTVASRTVAAPGTDGRLHVLYELQLTNAKAAPATIQRLEVLDAARRPRVLARFAGPSLLSRMTTLAPRSVLDTTIEPNASRFVFVELSFASRRLVPRRVVHRLRVLGAKDPGTREPTPLEYTAAPLTIGSARPPQMRPPLRGPGWVTTNGCCDAPAHRRSIQTVNGGFFDAQRFAIDWIRIDRGGRFVDGDPADLRSYAAYGAVVHAAASGRVVSTLDRLPDSVPGTLPPPGSLTLATVDGNHVVMRLDGGLYAFYAHLVRGSVRVKPGDRVRRGQVIGRLGNSGNSSAPHLHFHLMTSPSVLGSDGVPFVLDAFQYQGRIDGPRFDAAPGLDGVWNETLLPAPVERLAQLPLNHTVAAFR